MLGSFIHNFPKNLQPLSKCLTSVLMRHLLQMNRMTFADFLQDAQDFRESGPKSGDELDIFFERIGPKGNVKHTYGII